MKKIYLYSLLFSSLCSLGSYVMAGENDNPIVISSVRGEWQRPAVAGKDEFKIEVCSVDAPIDGSACFQKNDKDWWIILPRLYNDSQNIQQVGRCLTGDDFVKLQTILTQCLSKRDKEIKVKCTFKPTHFSDRRLQASSYIKNLLVPTDLQEAISLRVRCSEIDTKVNNTKKEITDSFGRIIDNKQQELSHVQEEKSAAEIRIEKIEKQIFYLRVTFIAFIVMGIVGAILLKTQRSENLSMLVSLYEKNIC